MDTVTLTTLSPKIMPCFGAFPRGIYRLEKNLDNIDRQSGDEWGYSEVKCEMCWDYRALLMYLYAFKTPQFHNNIHNLNGRHASKKELCLDIYTTQLTPILGYPFTHTHIYIYIYNPP